MWPYGHTKQATRSSAVLPRGGPTLEGLFNRQLVPMSTAGELLVALESSTLQILVPATWKIGCPQSDVHCMEALHADMTNVILKQCLFCLF